MLTCLFSLALSPFPVLNASIFPSTLPLPSTPPIFLFPFPPCLPFLLPSPSIPFPFFHITFPFLSSLPSSLSLPLPFPFPFHSYSLFFSFPFLLPFHYLPFFPSSPPLPFFLL